MKAELEATPGTKTVYFIKRRLGTSREELLVHWFKNHMPRVIAESDGRARSGKSHVTKYIATLFEPGKDNEVIWDGMAQLWTERALPDPSPPFGTIPTDTFQEKAEPYVGWATTEYVVVDGDLPTLPCHLDDPYPATRSGFMKLTFLVSAIGGVNYSDLYRHWLEVHAPIVGKVMEEMGGIRYVISHSQNPETDNLAGMAELYFPDLDTYRAFAARRIADAGFSEFTDGAGTQIEMVALRSQTQFIGIPDPASAS